MLLRRFTTWILDGVSVEITEADVVSDLDSGFVPGGLFPSDSAR